MMSNQNQIFCIAVSLIGWLAPGIMSGQKASLWQIRGKALIELNPSYPKAEYPRFQVNGFWKFYGVAMPGNPFRVENSSGNGPASVMKHFSPADLALFCRLEYKMEKVFRFPVKVRLGEVQYVEEMEGKISSMKINPTHRVYGPR